MTAGPVQFFHDMQDAFARIATAPIAADCKAEALAGLAFDLFEKNIEIQTEGLPPPACEKGCPACCNLRVTATAPEIFLLAHYVEQIDATPGGAALGLKPRVAEAHRATADVGEKSRLKLHHPCPFVIQDTCIIHPVRPLACRGHVAFNPENCTAAALGEEDTEVAISEPHLVLRGLVQNALQAALRDAGLAWGLYELNQGLGLAFDGRGRQTAWAHGADSLAPVIPDLDMTALAAMFDQLAAMR